jgi:hypothetical protein
MGKGTSSASSDPIAGLAQFMQAQSAQQQLSLGSDWLNFARDAYATGNTRQEGIDALTERVVNAQLAAQDQAAGWAAEDRARWKSIFQPLQDQFIDKASNWDSPGALANAAAEARADVVSQGQAMKAANQREMAARGIRPDAGGYAGIERAMDLETGLAAAGAQNVARNQRRTQAMGLLGDALNIGSGLPSQALNASKLGVGAGSSAADVGFGANSQWRGNTDIMNAGFSGAGKLYGQAGNAWGNIFDTRTALLQSQERAQSSAASGIAGGLGSIAGLGLGGAKTWILSDEDAKERKRPARGILQAVENMRVEKWNYKEGHADEGEHIGTYAQDFHRETGFGDGKTIPVVDALGVTMGAVKELAEKVKQLEKSPRARGIMRKAA